MKTPEEQVTDTLTWLAAQVAWYTPNLSEAAPDYRKRLVTAALKELSQHRINAMAVQMALQKLTQDHVKAGGDARTLEVTWETLWRIKAL